MANGFPTPCIKIGDYILRFEEEELGEEYEERARKELRETPEVVSDAITTLKSLLRDDKELIFPLDEEIMLLMFLRPCKFYPESAYAKIKHYYLFRLKNPTICNELLPSTVKNPLLQDILTILPLRTQHGRRIFLIEIGKWKTKEVSLIELYRSVLLLVEIAVTEYRTQISGVEVIYDLEGLKIQHVYQIGPIFAKLAVQWAQECVPLRLKGHHVVNQPYIFNMLFALFKPFLSQKFRNRIYFHGRNYSSLLKHIDENCLPKNYGGKMGNLQFDRMEFYEHLLKYEDDFKTRTKYGYYKKAS